MQEELSFSSMDGEVERVERLNPLSVLLYPPVASLLFGVLLFVGLLRIPVTDDPVFSDTGSFAEADASAMSVSAEIHSGKLAPFFAPQVLRWESKIVEWAEVHELNTNLVATVMQIESCGDPQALSRAGAMGLFQVMPYHFADGEDSYDPATNARRGLGYLAKSLEAFKGDASMAMAGYNGGINGASRPQWQWAQETIDYKYWGENIYADAHAGRSSSAVLDEWMAAGGASLCAQAGQRLAALP